MQPLNECVYVLDCKSQQKILHLPIVYWRNRIINFNYDNKDEEPITENENIFSNF